MQYSVDNLCYQLLEGPVCLESLQVMDKRSITWHNRHVTFYVLGASHAVFIETKQGGITELLTCAPITSAGRTFAEGVITEGREWHITAPELICHIQVQPFALADGDALNGRFDKENSLAVAYPTYPTGPIPMTRIGWSLDQRYITVETVHTYPEEGHGARSRTVFMLNDTETTEAASSQDPILLESIV